MNGREVVAALVGLDGGSHSILSIKEEIKLPTPLDRSFRKLFFSYLEELKEHVIKVGGHVHDADRRVLLTCGGNAASLHSCNISTSSPSNSADGSARSHYYILEGFCQYCQMHLALSHT